MRRRPVILVLIVAMMTAAGVVVWRRIAPPGGPVSEQSLPRLLALAGPTMGSTWSVKLHGLPAGMTRERVAAEVQGVFDRVDGQMSTFKPDSDLSRFNRHRGVDWFEVPEDVARVAAEARRVSEETGGAFDVTVGPLVNLWGFGPIPAGGPFGTVPSDAAVRSAREHVGYQRLHVLLSPPALRKEDPEAFVDLSAVAKGYAADLAAGQLDALGVADYLVEVGGELRAKGVSHAGRPWRVGIDTPDPAPGGPGVFRRVGLRNLSIATSGDYRNYFDKDGRRYSHEIDPRSGRPVTGGLASVSVVHPSCAYADAMATALMVLGADEGYDLARRRGLAVLFISRTDRGFESKATPGFERLVVHSVGPSGTPGRSEAR